MKFQREWYYVLYAISLLILGLFIERFFCRFLCPLGAFMVLGGKLRLKNPLKRSGVVLAGANNSNSKSN